MSQHLPSRHVARRRVTHTLSLRPMARAMLVCALITVPVAGLLQASTAHAQQAVRSYTIAPAPLGTALSNFAAAADITLSFDAEQTRGKQSAGLNGSYSVEAGLRALLAGSGLQAVHLKDGNYVLRAEVAGSGATDDAVLPAVHVAGTTNRDLPPAYAGGQVARGGSLGLLGNTDVVDSPFSQSSFTAEFIRNTQSQTLGEALESSPSVRRNSSRFSQNDTYSIRGFGVAVGNDIAYDGMYGMTNTRRNAVEGIERVEVFRGPSALLNGVPAGGSIGGSVNLVPKRPTADPLTELTLSYIGESQGAAHLDVSRRFGPDQRMGIRTNLAHREGDTTYDFNHEKATHASVALDYLGDRFRLFAHLNQEDQRLDGSPLTAMTLSPGVPVPKAPEAGRNFLPPFNYTDTSRLVGLVRAEYDFNENWTGSVALGAQDIDETQLTSLGMRLLNAQGDYSRPTANRLVIYEREGRAADAKLRGKFETGSIKHNLVVGYSGFRFDQVLQTYSAAATGSGTNIYNPDPNAEPVPVFNAPPSLANQRLEFNGVAIADTLDFLDGRVSLTLGVRRQQIKETNLGIVAYDRSATSPSVALVVKPWDGWSVYGNYIEGLSRGPTPPASAQNADDIFPPFVSKQHEVGVKHDSGKILTTLALFEITRPSGITDPVTNVFGVDGEQRNRGLELESFGEVARGVRVIGGFTLLDAKLTRTQNGVNEGNFAVEVPKFSANLSMEWDTPFASGLTLTARAIHTGSQFIDAANTLEIPSWTRYDLGARYLLKAGNTPVTLRASLVNLFDSNYFESTRLLTGAPRTLALSATFSF